MDWFLYDNGLRHERVKHSSQQEFLELICLTTEGWKVELTMEPPICFLESCNVQDRETWLKIFDDILHITYRPAEKGFLVLYVPAEKSSISWSIKSFSWCSIWIKQTEMRNWVNLRISHLPIHPNIIQQVLVS